MWMAEAEGGRRAGVWCIRVRVNVFSFSRFGHLVSWTVCFGLGFHGLVVPVCVFLFFSFALDAWELCCWEGDRPTTPTGYSMRLTFSGRGPSNDKIKKPLQRESSDHSIYKK